MEALEGSEIAHFRTAARERFRDFLEASGYLDEREPVDADALRAGVLASVADDIGRGILSVDDVDRLLARTGAFLAVSLPRNPIATVP
jgi:hypothetical protein